MTAARRKAELGGTEPHELVLLGRHGVVDVRLDGSGQPGEGGAEGEGEQLEPEGVDAHGGGRGLVLADGDPGTADAGFPGAAEDEHDDGGEDEHQQVVVGGPAEVEAEDVVLEPEVEPEEVEVGDAGDALGAVGEVGAAVAVEVVHGEAEDLTEAERDDGEVVTAQPQGGCADQDAEDE